MFETVKFIRKVSILEDYLIGHPLRINQSLHMYHHILESLKSLCIIFLSGFFLHFLHPSHIISIPLRLLYLILVCITNINNRKWSEEIMKNSLLKITMKEMIVLFINHITIRSNWHTYPLINWVANPLDLSHHISLNFEIFMMYFESLFLELSLLETSAMVTVCIIRKDVYSPGRIKQWLIRYYFNKYQSRTI